MFVLSVLEAPNTKTKSLCVQTHLAIKLFLILKSENHGPDSCLLKKEVKVLPKTHWSTQWETPQIISIDRLEQHVACSNVLWFLIICCCIHLCFVFILLDLFKSCRHVLGSLYKSFQLQTACLCGAFWWKFTDHFKRWHFTLLHIQYK